MSFPLFKRNIGKVYVLFEKNLNDDVEFDYPLDYFLDKNITLRVDQRRQNICSVTFGS